MTSICFVQLTQADILRFRRIYTKRSHPKGCWEVNSDDMKAKGRSATGARNGKSKLTDMDVLTIRKMYVTGRYSTPVLGLRFGVCHSTIRYVLTGRFWKKIAGVPQSKINAVLRARKGCTS